MDSARMSSTARFADPSIATVIFAPKPQNYTLASVSFDDISLEALCPECWIAEELPRQQVLSGFDWAQLEWLTSEYLRKCIKVLTTTSVSVPCETETLAFSAVPARTYPFATHLSLLGGTVEGVFVDPEESQSAR